MSVADRLVLQEHRVLKQTWSKTHSPTEAEMLDDLDSDFVGRISRSVTLGGPTINPSSLDCENTSGGSNNPAIRGGIVSVSRAWVSSVFDPPIFVDGIAQKPPRDPDFVSYRRRITYRDENPETPGLPLTPRIQTRTLMTTYGWPIKFFKDLKELVQCLRDAIQGTRRSSISM